MVSRSIMIELHRKILSCSLTVLLCCPAWAETKEAPGNLSILSYGSAHGLTDPVIWALTQDRRGTIWAGTEGGLFRLEGERFRRFGPKEGLDHGYITGLCPDGPGLWIGTDGGLYHFNGHSFDLKAAAAQGVVRGMGLDDSGRLWALTDQALFHQEGALAFKKIDTTHLGPIASLWVDSSRPGIWLLAFDGKLYWMDPKDPSKRSQRGQSPDLQGQAVGGFLRDRQGRWWIRTGSKLLRSDTEGRHFLDLSREIVTAGRAPGFLLEDKHGRIWVPTSIGLQCWNGDAWRRLNVGPPLKDSFVNCVFLDHLGMLWAGGEELHKVQSAWEIHRRGEGLPANQVWRVLRDRKGKLWAATDRGAAQLGPNGWEALLCTENTVLTAMILGPDGHLWAGGESGGQLWRWNPDTGQGGPVTISGLPQGTILIRSLAFDREGHLWFACEAGLFKASSQSGTWQALAEKLPGSATSQAAEQVLVDHGGRLWAVTAQGLFLREQGAWKQLPCEKVACLTETPMGTIWTASAEGGHFNHWSWENKQLRILEQLQRAEASPVWSLASDTQGGLWVGTSHGLHHHQKGKWSWISRGDGLPGDDCSQHGIWLDPDAIWVGTSRGLGRMPFSLTPPPPAALATQVDFFNLGKLISFGFPPRLERTPFGARNTEFQFSAPMAADPAKVRTEIRWKGGPWQEIEKGSIRFSELSHGLHRLEARSCSLGGPWGEVLELPFQILPPWWATGWARLGFAVAGLSFLLTLIHSLRLRMLSHQNRILAHAIDVQTQNLRDALEEARKANRAKDEFLATMSHEIRTPMHAILGVTELMERTPLAPEQKEFTRHIRHAGRALLSLINDILDLAKAERGEIALREAPLRLRPLLEELVDLMGIQARAKHLDLRLELSENEHWDYQGDRERLWQILMNLLGNAIKFTVQGWVVLEARSEPASNGKRHILLAVQDTGEGIAEDQLERIFEKFTQADSSIARRHGGTGLGLSITQRLVQAMGGSIHVQSERGKGSRFELSLELPLAQGVSEELEETLNAPIPQGLHVLIVEDSPVNRFVAGRLMKALGVEADMASTGPEALGMMEKQRFDMVFMDIQLPGMDGLQVTEAIRQRGWTVPVVATTAHALKGDEARFRAAGMDAFLPKPFGQAELRQILHSLGKTSVSFDVHSSAVTLDLAELDLVALQASIEDPEDLRELVQLFLEHAPTHLQAIQSAWEHRDAAALKSAAHALLGNARYVYAPALIQSCTHLEKAAGEGAWDRVPPLLEAVQSDLPRLQEQLKGLAGL